MLETLLPALPLIPLYAETHYRFRFFPFSLYYRKTPEIIFDMPWRIDPGQSPTIFLLIKGANRWPIEPESVTIRWESSAGESGEMSFPLGQKVNEAWFYLALTLPDKFKRPAHLSILPILTFTIRGRKKTVTVDNYFGLTKRPLETFLGSDPMPNFPGWIYGDVHLHTSLTSDQVEFGAPLEMTRHAAKLMGLNFVATTDHSYDLDDDPSNYLKNDPNLVKWKTSREKMGLLNRIEDDSCVLLPAEEISVRNGKLHNIHLLHFNDPRFFPGSGDGAEHWSQTRSEYDLPAVINERSANSISVAAHPMYKVPFLHRLLINRDEWSLNDLLNDGLDGAQILSGRPDSQDFRSSRQFWIEALLRGKRLAIYGGSDAHGNFNLFRQVKMPMIMLFRLDDQILGQARTVVQSDSNEPDAIIGAMKRRKTGTTTGPTGNLSILVQGIPSGEVGDIVDFPHNSNIEILMTGKSSTEFGLITMIELYRGDFDTMTEEIVWESAPDNYEFQESFLTSVSNSAYYRLEIKTPGNSRWPGVYLSTPIWVNVKS